MPGYPDDWDYYLECDWCQRRGLKGNWPGRPCNARGLPGSMGMWRWGVNMEGYDGHRVRMENAAKRDKALPKLYRRLMLAAAEAAEAKDKEVPGSSMRADGEGEAVDELGQLDERMSVTGEVDGEADAGGETETGEVPPVPAAASQSTPKPKHDHEADATKGQQRQAKSCTGPKGMIDEGVSLASDGGDLARIHAANRKAWPRGQEPIAADATAEDREIAELVRRGIIGVQDLQVDHDGFGEDVCPYTIRIVEARKKVRKGKNGRRQGVQVAVEPAPLHAESDWWYLDDEAYAQLLSDGAAELVDWSEASSFVHVE